MDQPEQTTQSPVYSAEPTVNFAPPAPDSYQSMPDSTQMPVNNVQSPVYSAPPMPNPYAQPADGAPKKKKKKGCLIAFLVVLILAILFVVGIVFLASFGGEEDDSKLPVDANGSQSYSTTQTIDQPDGNASKVAINEQVLFENDKYKITATSLDEDGFFGADINVLIENNSDKSITVQAESCSVNGIMVDAIFSADIAAGKKDNNSITLSSTDLEAANITTIKDIELVLSIYDFDSWDAIVKSEKIKIQTTADNSYVQPVDDSGFLAYEDDNVKIVVKKLNSSDSFWGSDLYLYIENNSDKSLTVQANDVSVNGFMVDPMFSCEIDAGKKAFDTISFFETDLENNSITDITNIELKFHIIDTETFDTVKDTDAIEIKF
ncbi:MAG: hypothetical protein ACI4W6_02325 [Acutalibacteraceae bacterium]